MGGERARVETSSKMICMVRLDRAVFEVLCPDSEVESVGNSVVFRCVPVVFPFVLDVTVLSSNVRVVGEVGFL